MLGLLGFLTGCAGLVIMFIALTRTVSGSPHGMTALVANDPTGPDFDGGPSMSTGLGYDATLDALHDTLQAAEYRLPYDVPARWPLLGDEPDTDTIADWTGHILRIIEHPTDAGAIVPLIVSETANGQSVHYSTPPPKPPGDDPRAGHPIRSYLG